MTIRFLLLLAAGVLGCASLKNDTTVCSEYRGLRCYSGADCAMDEQRGCRVCRCARY
jgi:hypothetical protein